MNVKQLTRLAAVLCMMAMLLAFAEGAFASEEPITEDVPVVEDAADVVIEEEPEGITEEFVEEPPVPEEEDGDPMALRQMWLDGASGTKYYSDFTTRTLQNETLRKGVDISSWQESVNWKKVAADGVEFVILRAAYRTYGSGKLMTDSYFAQNIRGAKAAGLKVGAYIFSQAITIDEAIAEADYILSLVSGYELDLPIVFDFEYVSGGRLTSSLGARKSTDICLAFCARVEAAGYDSMVYANLNTLKNNLYASEFSRVWLAHYTKKTSYTGAYEYWQCTDNGIVNGVSGPVDMDFWFEPKGKQQPEPTPAPAPEPETVTTGALPFSDVREKDWFYSCVSEAYKAGIVDGISKTIFSPGGNASRGQTVTMLYRLSGSPTWSVAASFTDLVHEYYRGAISWAAENSIVSGYSDTSFLPERNITREELVVILYRMSGSPEYEGDLSAFSDAEKVQSWAQDAMAWAVANHIISGYEDGTLRPQSNATRAEVCAILMRYAGIAE